MIHYNCACLVNIEKKNFLVRTYDNNKYYLPGGKIENQESFDEALIRELKEELSLRIKKSEVIFWKSIEGPAYPNTKETVLLNCFLFPVKLLIIKLIMKLLMPIFLNI